ncbi:hypothetical protein ACFX13_033767 [Malus domestica]
MTLPPFSPLLPPKSPPPPHPRLTRPTSSGFAPFNRTRPSHISTRTSTVSPSNSPTSSSFKSATPSSFHGGLSSTQICNSFL